MNCIISNFGDDSLALIQWAYENNIDDVVVISVDTGWQADSWKLRIQESKKWMKQLKFNHYHLKSENSFQELVKARKQFPSQQFHWCAGFLKGITILNWLEDNDDDAQATILLANRRDMCMAQIDLPDTIDESERYDNRKVVYPIAGITLNQRDILIERTPFKKPLGHRSLECQPCIHFTARDIKTISTEDIKKISALENEISQTMFDKEFNKHQEEQKKNTKNTNYYDEFAKTCSWDYGCGL